MVVPVFSPDGPLVGFEVDSSPAGMVGNAVLPVPHAFNKSANAQKKAIDFRRNIHNLFCIPKSSVNMCVLYRVAHTVHVTNT